MSVVRYSCLLGFLLVVVGVVRSRGKEPDYRVFFTIGLLWVAVGLLFKDISGLFTLGLIFLLIGLVNYDKWGRTSQIYSEGQENPP